MFQDVRYLEQLAYKMGFKQDDILLFENLTAVQTFEALAYGLLFLILTLKRLKF